MRQIPVNYGSIFSTMVFNSVIGSLWYGPVFGKEWQKVDGVSDETIRAVKYAVIRMLAGGAVMLLLMSLALVREVVFAREYLHLAGIRAGMLCALVSWLGFIVPVTLVTMLKDGAAWQQLIGAASRWLAAVLGIGALIGMLY